ncbi:13278_t:CDS:2, partial [Funneliformis geosporum]
LDSDVVEVRAEQLHAYQPDGERSACKGRLLCRMTVKQTQQNCNHVLQ